MSAETGAGRRSDYNSLWLRLLSLGSGYLWRLSTKQRSRFVSYNELFLDFILK